MATSINVKMYRVGELGDCFLITIDHNKKIRHLLIDCGSFRNSDKSETRMKEIATDIIEQVKKSNGKLDVVVGTHQHNDHLSGFVHAEDIFDKQVEQVWLSWLDNPRSKVASRIEENHLGLRKALVEASATMKGIADEKIKVKGKSFSANRVVGIHSLVDELLGFFGAAPALPSQGIKVLKKIGVNAVDYLSPGDVRGIGDIPLSEVKVHVLGPPKDEDLLYRKDPREGESYDHKMRNMHSMASHFLLALNNRTKADDKEEEQFPFNSHYKKFIGGKAEISAELDTLMKEYESSDWRNIDSDWLEQASRLALYMDTFTNNSSLVLAIELVKNEKVLLFAADAQTGNWLSWDKIKFKDPDTTIDGLLERTVFYKVGHHGSHNSTLKPALERMENDDLVAMIPVDKDDPNIKKENGWKMPASKLYQRLKEKTHNRVLRMDDGYAKDCDPTKDPEVLNSWKKVDGPPKITDLYIEFTIK
jgi:beta-lactamase superfamily II metal-dependent hydrolase